MNDLKNRVRKLEQVAKEKGAGERIFVWQRAGESQQEILSRYSKEDQQRLTIFSWILTGRLEDAYGPIDPYEMVGQVPDVSVSEELSEKVQQIIDEHNENILLYGAQRYIKLPPGARVRDVMSDFRELARNKDVIMYVYVTDEADKLLGVVDLHELIEAEPEQTLDDVMTTSVVSLNEKDTLREAVELFARYSFRAIPVVDDSEKLLGIVPFRDIKGLKHRLL